MEKDGEGPRDDWAIAVLLLQKIARFSSVSRKSNSGLPQPKR
jgi:hypothetical protein